MEIIFYRVDEFCKKYVVSKSTLYREVRAGRLAITKRGRSTLIARIEADRWLASFAKQDFDSTEFIHIIGTALQEPAPVRV